MAKLREVTKLVRSKNPGPFVLTFDIMFDDPETYKRVRDSGVVNRELVGRLYNQQEDEVLFFSSPQVVASAKAKALATFAPNSGDAGTDLAPDYITR